MDPLFTPRIKPHAAQVIAALCMRCVSAVGCRVWCSLMGGERITSIQPKAVLDAMHGQQWRERRQQDAHEYYVALLDQLMAEVLTTQTQVRQGSRAAQVTGQQGVIERGRCLAAGVEGELGGVRLGSASC